MELDASTLPRSSIRWATSYRVISSRFPPVSLFEEVADPGDLEAVYAVESLTNDRLRDQVGDLSLVAPEERVTGAGAGYVMASFTHISLEGGRFHDGNFGAYYAAADRATAVAETVYHSTRFLAFSHAPPQELDQRVLRARIEAEMHDLRGLRTALPAVYHLDDYTAGQQLARELRSAGSWGIAYDSVRHENGTCVAVLRPRAIRDCKQAEHLGYVWDGTRIALVYEKRILPRWP
jgi:hypothetical protein